MSYLKRHGDRFPVWLVVTAALILLTGCSLFGGGTPEATPATPGGPTPLAGETPSTGGEPLPIATIAPDGGDLAAPGTLIIDALSTLNAGDTTPVELPFEAAAGQVVRIDSMVTAGVLDFDMELVDAFGNVLVRGQSRAGQTGVTINELTLPYTTTYTLRLIPVGGGANLQTVVTALDAPSGGGRVEDPAGQYGGRISAANVYHTFLFAMNKGDLMTIGAIAESRGAPDTRLMLFSPDGGLITEIDDVQPPDDLNAVLRNFVAPVSGTYVALVSAVDGTTGAYTFQVTPGSEAPQAVGEPDITYGQNYRAVFIDGDVLALTFDGSIGDVLRIECDQLDPQVDVDLRVYSPFGQVIAFSVDDNDVSGDDQVLTEMQLPYTGRFTLELTPAGSGEGSFRIRQLTTADLSGGGFFGDDSSGMRAGFFDRPDVFHYYQFNASAGQLITLRVASSSDENLDIGFALLDPAGAQVAFADDSTGENPLDPELVGYRVNTSGTYTVIVYALTDAAGTYELSFQRQ